MSESSSVLSALLTGGVGATIGGVLTAAIQTAGRRHESKASAADLITKAAGTMVERLDEENRQLRKAILLMIEVLDEVAPTLHGTPEVARKLQEAKRAAERAVI